MFIQYLTSMIREWVLWIFFGLDAIGLVLRYAPLASGKPSEVQIPPVVLWLLPVFGLFWAGYRVYASVPRMNDEEARMRRRDLEVFEQLNAVLPSSGSIRWLRDYDFGSAFKLEWLEDLYRFQDAAEDPAFEFFDEELEDLRLGLLSKISEFTHTIGKESFPVKGDPEGGVISRLQPGLRKRDPAKFRNIQDRVNRLAGEVVDEYEALIRIARRKL